MIKKLCSILICWLLTHVAATHTTAQVLVKDITPGLDPTVSVQKMSKGTYRSENHLEYNGKLIFTANTSLGTPRILSEPFITDGTPQGTHLLKNINPNFSSDPQYYTEFNGEVYFQANDGTHGIELWKTDGTESGTVMVKDIIPGALGSGPINFVVYKNNLYFIAATAAPYAEVWRTDGTASGTVKVNSTDDFMYYTGREMAVYRDTLFLITSNDRCLYKSGDGTNFTKCLTPTGGSVEQISELVIWDTMLVFTGYHSNPQFNVGNEVYMYTSANSVELLCNVDGTNYPTSPQYLTPIGDKLYFAAYVDFGVELYVIDDDSSTKATLVKDINPGALHSGPASLYPVGNRLLFTAHVGTGGNVTREVYSTDGTSAGTIQLTSGTVNTGSAGPSQFSEFTPVGNEVYFVATPSIFKPTLYATDGTVAGTRVVNRPDKDEIVVRPGYEMMDYNNKLYFFGDNGRIGTELYVMEKRWMETQDSTLDARLKVWVKADTNLMYSHKNSNAITTLVNDVVNYEMFTATGSAIRTDPSIIQNARNGNAVIQFNTDAQDGYLQTLANKSVIKTQSATIITVAAKAVTANNRNTLVGLRPTPGFANSILLAESNKFGNNTLSAGIHDGSSYCSSVGNTAWAADAQYSIITASVDKNIVYTKVNGRIQDSINNSCTIADEIKAMYIGGSDFEYEPFEGNIGEVFVFDTVLTRTQRNMLEMYLALKFKAGADTVTNPSIGNSKGIYVFDNAHAAVYFVKNNDGDNNGSLATTVVPGNPGAGAGFTGSATSHDGTVVTPSSIGINNYWRISNNGISDFEYDIMLDLNNVNIDSLEQRVILKRDSATAKWQPLNTKRFGKYLYAQGLTSFSEFAVSSNMPDTVTPPVQSISFINNNPPTLMIYPNPAHNIVSIKMANAESGSYHISLQSVQGRSVIETTKHVQSNTPAVIDINTLAPGIYLLQVTGSNGIKHNAKIIKR